MSFQNNFVIIKGGGDPGNPGETLSSLAEALWEADDNGIGGSDLVFNRQEHLSNYQARNDLSTQP